MSMKRRMRSPDLFEVIVAVCFLTGGLFGCIFAGRANAETLAANVAGYLDSFSVGHSPIYLFFTNVLTHLKYPLILFVFSFTVFGTLVIPAVIFIKGYALTFAFSALIRVLGANGYLAIPVMFGIQSIGMLPFLLLAAIMGLRITWTLLRVNHLHIKSSQALSHTPDFHGLITCFVLVLLSACVCALFDTYITPHLLALFSFP